MIDVLGVVIGQVNQIGFGVVGVNLIAPVLLQCFSAMALSSLLLSGSPETSYVAITSISGI